MFDPVVIQRQLDRVNDKLAKGPPAPLPATDTKKKEELKGACAFSLSCPR